MRNNKSQQLAGRARCPECDKLSQAQKQTDRSLGVCELQQLFTPAATAKLAAAGPTLVVLLVKNMTVFLTFCSLHFISISARLVYRSRNQVCQATLPNFLADFCDKFLAQLPVVPRRARCVDCVIPVRNKKWQTSGRLRVCGFSTFVPEQRAPGLRRFVTPLRRNVAGSLGVCESATKY